MLTIDKIKARFVEAAETERNLPSAQIGPASSSGFWPEIVHTVEDVRGWGAERYREQRQADFNRVKLQPSAEAISRWEEVLGWCIDLVEKEDRRKLLKAWAACQVKGNFLGWLRKHDIARTTAKRRLNTEFEKIEIKLRNKCKTLRNNVSKSAVQINQTSDIDFGMMDEPTPGGNAWMSADAKPSDRPEFRDISWANDQNERRRRRLEKLERAA